MQILLLRTKGIFTKIVWFCLFVCFGAYFANCEWEGWDRVKGKLYRFRREIGNIRLSVVASFYPNASYYSLHNTAIAWGVCVCVCVCVCERRDFRMYSLSILGVTLLLTDHIYAVLNFIDINTSKNVCLSSEFNDKRKWSLYSICFIHNECKWGQI